MKFKQKILLLVIVPLIFLGVTLTILTTYIASDSKVKDNLKMLKIALDGFNGDVYAFKEDDIDITIFEGDTRVESSIEGAVGTKASEEVIQIVLKEGKEYQTRDVVINGVDYMGYYKPTDNGMIFAGRPKAEITHLERIMSMIIVGFALAFILVDIVVILFAINKMIKPILKSSETVKSIADGDLTCRVDELKGKDEIAAMNNSVGSMVHSLNEVMHKVSDVSNDVMSLSEEISSMTESAMEATGQVATAIENVASDATNQAGAVSEIVNSIDMMVDDGEDIHNAVDSMIDYVGQLNNSGNDMKQKIEVMSKGSSQMTEQISIIAVKIHETNEAIKKMTDILSVIEEIASQTSLLSLNASIEAARAGEAGRGFSVVAESIKNLAENTSSELDNIKQIIDSLTGNFTACGEYIENVVDKNKENLSYTGQVINSFETIFGGIEATGNKLQDVTRITNEMNDLVHSISNQIENIEKSAESTAAATQEVTASSEELAALMHRITDNCGNMNVQANHLVENLTRFTID
ncbi:MAG: methyl-accepting chemotaxis protein [Lachnospira sp.]